MKASLVDDGDWVSGWRCLGCWFWIQLCAFEVSVKAHRDLEFEPQVPPIDGRFESWFFYAPEGQASQTKHPSRLWKCR